VSKRDGAPDRPRAAILVMISYEIDVGFAIGRLIRVFHQACARYTGSAGLVHFSFGRIAGQTCPNLPDEFANILEFDYKNPDASAFKRLSAYIREHGIETIVGLDLSVSASFLPVARNAGVRNVVGYWGAPMSSINSGVRLLLKRLEVKFLHRHRPDLFIFESEAMRRMAVCGRGIRADDTAVVHTGVDAGRFCPLPAAAGLMHARFSIPQDRRVIVYMGHLHERKGVHVLMQAMDYIVNKRGHSDLHAVFLGNRNSEEGNFRKFWEPAATHITFGGYQSDVPELMSGCYLGCIPSTGWDSFPMSSLEMQACGLPVVVSDWQGVPETVADGETGLVTPTGNAIALGDALIELVDDPARRARMSIAARVRIEAGYTLPHQVDNLLVLLQHRFGTVA
jgi:glycosyltransferase involved in cell wall biosynthesis